jgi:hypothetical protein
MKNNFNSKLLTINSKISALFLFLFFILVFPMLSMAEYRIDLTYKTTPLYADQYWDEGYYIGFRTGRMMGQIEKTLVKSITEAKRPEIPVSYVTREEYEQQLKQAEESRREWQREYAERKWEEKMERLKRERKIERAKYYWTTSYPRVIYSYPRRVYHPSYHYPLGGLVIRGSGKDWWFSLNIPFKRSYREEYRVIVR